MLFSTASVWACREYDWDGSSSSNWNTNSNWGPSAGSQNLSDDQVYNIGNPSDWDAANAPVISANNVHQIDGIQIFEGGYVSITGGTTSIDQDLYIYDNGDLTISAGSLAVDNIYMIDAGSSITVSGGTLSVAGDIFLGRENPNNSENNTNGTPTLTITGGFVECFQLRFDDNEGDDPAVVVSGGELEVTTAIISDGAPVDITLSGTGVIDVQGDVIADEGNDVLDMSGGEFYVEGDWDWDGTTSISGGTFYLNGSSAQDVSNVGGIIFSNLVINNTSGAGITLNDRVTVMDSIAMVDGLITNTAASPVILANGVATSGGGSACYVNGYVRKAGNEAFTFLVGDGSSINQIAISAPSAATDTFTAAYFNTDPDGSYSTANVGTGLNNVSRREYWLLDRVGSSSVEVTLYWDAASGPIANLSDLRIAHWIAGSSSWENEGNGGTTGDATSGTIVSSGAVSSFSPFTLGSVSWANPLPVIWQDFKATVANEKVFMHWVTASELNCSHYIVQRSTDGLNYKDIGKVTSKAPNGNSSSRLNYEFVDVAPEVGIAYYRIKQVDFNADIGYSWVEQTELVKQQQNAIQSDVQILQSAENLIIDSEKAYSNIRLEVYSITGALVYKDRLNLTDGRQFQPLQTDLGTGIFIVRLIDTANGQLLAVNKILRYGS